MKIAEECKLYIKISKGRYYDTGHKVGDFDTSRHWAESVKMAKGLEIKLECYNEKYFYDDSPPLGFGEPSDYHIHGPFTLPELHEKLISLRESEGE